MIDLINGRMHDIHRLLENKMLDTALILENHYKITMPIPKIHLRRLGKKLGVASKFHNVITVNIDLCTQATWKDILDITLPHEYCHLVAPLIHKPYLHGHDRGNAGWGHGPAWKECMRIIGLQPNVQHELPDNIVNQIVLRKVNRDYVYSCGCGKTFNLTSVRHNKILLGKKYFCRTCTGRLTFNGVKA
jgi:predicted SprT family Zn-dependent metalloprotease